MMQKIIKNKYFNKAAIRITLIYIISSALWILFSDKLLLTNSETAVYISTGKGWFYTVVVGIFFYITMSRELNNLQLAENKIEKYQKLLEASLESQKDTILLSIDKNYNYLYFNKAHANSMKQVYNKEAKIGLSILDCISLESDRLAAKLNYDRALTGESHQNVHTYGDQNKIYYESFFNPIYNDNNEIIGATALARDVTESQKLKEKNAWLASFPLLNPSPVLEINKNCKIIFINQVAKDIFPEIEMNCAAHPFLTEATSYFDKLNVNKKNSVQREINIDNKWYLQTLFLVSENSLRVYATDITEEKEKEQIIIEDKNKYYLLFSNMINAFAYHKIITNDKNEPIDYQFLEVNHQFEIMTGLKQEEIINKKVTEVIPETNNDSINWIKKYGQVALTGQGEIFESYSAGLKKWFSISVYSPQIDYFVTIFEDITPRKLSEIKSKELDKLKDSFLIITTHELKTPLIPIKSQSQLLLAGNYGELNPEQRKAIDMILRNEEHINRLTSDVMDQTKINSKNLKIELTETDVNEVFLDVISDLEDVAKEKNIQISVSPLTNVVKIKIDKQRIQQVLNNLLNNAIKFTADGGSVSLELTSNQDHVNFIIKDTGIGISAENLKKLFTPFSQIDCDLNRKYRGTGLGLAIAKGIVEAHGGHITAESAGENQGSTFSFSLPIN